MDEKKFPEDYGLPPSKPLPEVFRKPLFSEPTTGKVLADGWVQMGNVTDVTFAADADFEDIPGWDAVGATEREFTITWSIQEVNPLMLDLFFGYDWALKVLPWHRRYWLKFKRKLKDLYEHLHGSVVDRLAGLGGLFGARASKVD